MSVIPAQTNQAPFGNPDTADLDLLLRVARIAGDIATPIWERSHDVWDKGGGAGPVTEADLAVNAMLHEELRAARPDYGWLSEETDETDDTVRQRQDTERCFVIDPIDGTRAFTAGERTWAHSISVVDKGTPVAGVVYLPLRDKLYAAARGTGATLNGDRIEVSGRSGLNESSVLAARPAMDAKHWRDGVPAVRRAHRPSLAYRLSLVAEGRFDAMLTLRKSWEWDIAAGAIIVSEAGGAVSDRTGGTLVFNTRARLLDGVAVGTPDVHTPLVDALA